MGVMTRKSGEDYIITSDRVAGEGPSKQAPKPRASATYQVWTGNEWSATLTDAKLFAALDVADEYMRQNYGRIMA